MKKCENDELFHVEHSEYSFTSLIRIVLLVLVTLLPACKSEDPEPEKKDPIYSDLAKELASSTSAAEKEIKKIEDLTKEYQKTEVRTIDRKSVGRDRALAQENLRKYEQQMEYYRIAMIKRQHEARTSYKRAFAEGKPWPDPKEAESYFQDKKMMAVSRNWNVRVPKPGVQINSVKIGEGAPAESSSSKEE